MTETTSGYSALALQTTCYAVNKLSDASSCRDRMLGNIEIIRAQIAASKKFIGPHTKLVVLPEYFLTGFPMGESIEQWADKACVRTDGPEYKALSSICTENDIYLSGNLYELDDHFPGLYFQTSFIIDDKGELILRYRRLVSMFAPTPHDVLDKYIDIYGKDSLFPVADTPLGRLAAVASEEILYPEITRALALKGAEIICHSSSEIGSPLATPKAIARQARAYENHLCIVSANSAGIADIDIPFASTDGGSCIIDYHGHTLAQADTGESMVANADIEIESLRHYRNRPSMFNTLSRQRLELFAPIYAENQIYPANSLIQNGQPAVPDRSHFIKTQASTIASMKDKGILK